MSRRPLPVQAMLALFILAIITVLIVGGSIGAYIIAEDRATETGERSIEQTGRVLQKEIARSLQLRAMAAGAQATMLGTLGGPWRDSSFGNDLGHELADQPPGYVIVANRDGTIIAADRPRFVGLSVVIPETDSRLSLHNQAEVFGQLGVEASALPRGHFALAWQQPLAADDPMSAAQSGGSEILLITGVQTLEVLRLLEAAVDAKGGFAALLSDDGRVLTALPEASGADARAMVGPRLALLSETTPPFTELLSGTIAGTETDWLLSARAIPQTNLVVMVGVPADAVIAAADMDGWVLAIVLGLSLSALAVLTYWLVRAAYRQRSIESELATITERLNLAFEGSNDGVWDWDTERNRAFYSARWCEMLGYRPEDVEQVPQSWMTLLHPDDVDDVRNAMQAHLDGRVAVYQHEHRMRCADGRYLWVESRGKAPDAPDGRRYRMVGTMTDIEEKKRQEQVILAARDEAEAADRAKSDFLATMSHEIRTPINGVLGMTTLLLRTALTSAQKRYADTIKSSGETLLAILNDILDLSKLEAGKLDLEHADYRVADAVGAVVRLLEPHARSKRLQLAYDLSGIDTKYLHGDQTRLRQVLFNLVGNAIKFTDEGRVTVTGQTTTLRDGRVALAFEVTDTGIGLTADQMSRLFQKFHQADVSTTRRFGGTGLGLAICRRLVSAMGGEITVESTEGEGATFRFYIVCDKASAPVPPLHADDTARQASSIPPSLTVLVAEDNDINRTLVRELLGPHVRRLDMVEDGARAIQAARAFAYDVVLMDVQMPGTDGLSATRQIRALGGHWADCPIIALTANAMADQIKKYLDAGMTDYITKPVDWNRLFSMLAGITPLAGVPANAGPSTASDEARKTPEGDATGAATDQSPVEDHGFSSLDLLDEPALAEIVRVIGQPSVADLLDTLLAQSDQCVATLRSATAASEYRVLGHTLAGAAGNCRATRLSAIGRAVESAAGDPLSIAHLTGVLATTVAATRAAVEEWKARNAPKPSSDKGPTPDEGPAADDDPHQPPMVVNG